MNFIKCALKSHLIHKLKKFSIKNQQLLNCIKIFNSGYHYQPSEEYKDPAITQKKSQVYHNARKLLEEIKPIPKVIVFDLDFTLWPIACRNLDNYDHVALFPHVLDIIKAIKSKDLFTAIASRTPSARKANFLINALKLRSYIDSIQIIAPLIGLDEYAARKHTCHFPIIRKHLDIHYDHMLYFDAEKRFTKKLLNIGVCSMFVDRSVGLDLDTFEQGLLKYSKMFPGDHKHDSAFSDILPTVDSDAFDDIVV